MLSSPAPAPAAAAAAAACRAQAWVQLVLEMVVVMTTKPLPLCSVGEWNSLLQDQPLCATLIQLQLNGLNVSRACNVCRLLSDYAVTSRMHACTGRAGSMFERSVIQRQT